MARYYSYSAPEGWTCSLISPKLQLNPTDNSVRYWIYRNFNNNINRPDRINVYYSPTTNTADGTLLGTVHRNTMMDPVVGENSDWYEYTYSFDSPEGYGFVIGRSEQDGKLAVEKLSADFSGEKTGEAEYALSGKVLEIKVPRQALSLAADVNSFYFKVADGVENPSDIMDYYVSGKAFPVGRLSFRYLG